MYKDKQQKVIEVRLIVLTAIIFSLNSHAHEILSTTQHVGLRRYDQVGWLQDLSARVNVNEKFDVGAQGTYLERFDLYEKRAGGFLTYRPSDRWNLEARYLQGMGNEILPEKQAILSAYYSLSEGLAPYLYYKDSRYSVTRLHTVNLGIEIEKISNFIIVPSFLVGRATFNSPSKTDDVYNYGLRMTYLKEKKYALLAWAYKGRESSQGIVGVSTILVDTLSGGVGAAYYVTENFKTELLFDHTDYDQLKTEFHTTTLNLSWMF